MWLILNSIQWLLILIVTIICGPIAMLIALVSPKTSFFFSKHVWARMFCILAGANIQIKNRGRIANLDEHVIFCSNHQSNYDIIAIYRTAINPIYFIAKKELKNLPFIGWYIRTIGMIFIDRSNREKAMESMKKWKKYPADQINQYFPVLSVRKKVLDRVTLGKGWRSLGEMCVSLRIYSVPGDSTGIS